MVKMAMSTVPKAITPKVGKPELRFISSACHLMMNRASVAQLDALSD